MYTRVPYRTKTWKWLLFLINESTIPAWSFSRNSNHYAHEHIIILSNMAQIWYARDVAIIWRHTRTSLFLCSLICASIWSFTCGMSVRLVYSVCPSDVCLSCKRGAVPFCKWVQLSVYVCRYVGFFTSVSISLSRQSVSLSNSLLVCLSVCLPVCLSAYVFVVDIVDSQFCSEELHLKLKKIDL